MNSYKLFVRPFLFLIDPEKIHHLVFSSLKLFFRIPGLEYLTTRLFVVRNPRLERTVAGLKFMNPVGLAAGFDKDARLFNELSTFGFGFIEVGTVTPLPQPGNEKPRMFRLRDDEALINRMGFNNDGVEAMVERLRKRKPGIVVGGNIGKNKATPNESSIRDYEICFTKLFSSVDYFAVNVSSPNTPDLRALQEKEPLLKLLQRLQELNHDLAGTASPQATIKPVFLKIAPDLNNSQLDDIIDVVLQTKLSGIIATNTTLNRENLKTDREQLTQIGAGGLSGKPLSSRSTEIIRYLAQKSNGRFEIIGSGGIHSPGDALEKINAGASLVQLYTGFVYEGPGLVKQICKDLLK